MNLDPQCDKRLAENFKGMLKDVSPTSRDPALVREADQTCLVTVVTLETLYFGKSAFHGVFGTFPLDKG